MTAISKKARRKGLFQDSYTLDYALRVTERHTHTRQVLSARCLFCIYNGREQPCEGRVRQSTVNSKDFKAPFRAELFRRHHERQHLSIWRQYQSASEQDKSTFFDVYVAYENTVLRDFFGGIATVFANTASVESDFSILGWERDEYRLSLTDLSLEGIMQSKQHELLKSLI